MLKARIERGCGIMSCRGMEGRRYSSIALLPRLNCESDEADGEGTLQADSVFSGISTFGRIPYFPCLASDEEKFDIAFLGASSLQSVVIMAATNDLRRSLRHRNLLPPRRTFRPIRNPSRFPPSKSLVLFPLPLLPTDKICTPRLTQTLLQRRLQHPPLREPLQLLGTSPGLRRYPRNVLR